MALNLLLSWAGVTLITTHLNKDSMLYQLARGVYNKDIPIIVSYLCSN